jgi:cell wall-associated NlpC family hydrolase
MAISSRRARLAIVSAFVVAAIVASGGLSAAAPTRAEVEAARAELDALNERLSLLVEEYNVARVKLQAVEGRLAEVRVTMREASATAEAARRALESRAVSAFTGIGGELDSILGAGSFSEFTDRLEFLGTIAEDDVELAALAERARQEAEWAAGRLERAVEQRTALVERIDAKTTEIRDAIADQEALVERYEDELARAQEARRQAPEGDLEAPEGDPGGTPPPALSPGAQAAIDAAYSALGVPYLWGGSSPSTGFDCSGLTMWAWAHAGVSLPHSSQMQYSALPRVDRSQLQPGDLVFFYSPIHHVGLYIGGGQMIDAPHTGTVVAIRPVMWDRYVGAARPG